MQIQGTVRVDIILSTVCFARLDFQEENQEFARSNGVYEVNYRFILPIICLQGENCSRSSDKDFLFSEIRFFG